MRGYAREHVGPHQCATAHAMDVKEGMRGQVAEGNGRRSCWKRKVSSGMRNSLEQLGLVNPQPSSPSTLMSKDCPVCGELKTAVCVLCLCVSSQATVWPALHRNE